MTEVPHERSRRRHGPGGMESRRGLTNGEVAMEGLDVGTGLINGLGSGPRPEGSSGLPLRGTSKRKRRAVRRAMERKASAPLPGTDGD